MKMNIARPLVVASLVLGFASLLSSAAYAQTPAQAGTTTRAQVKMDRDAFLSMARWDDVTGSWVLKEGMAMPEGVASREEVKAMRDKFLSMNKWNEATSSYVPVTGAPRDMSKLSRSQVKAETVRFLKMHRFDESKSAWVAKAQ